MLERGRTRSAITRVHERLKYRGEKKEEEEEEKMPERYGFGGLQESETMARSDALDLFSPEPVEGRTLDRKPCQAKPTSGVSGPGPFQIVLPSEKFTYIDPGSIRIIGTFKIRRVNAAREVSDLPDPADVMPVNLFTKSLFKDIEVELENQKISLNSSNTYGVKAYVSTALSYGKDAATGHLACSGWLKDTAGKFDNFDQNTNGLERATYIAKSKLFSFADNLHTELTTTNRLITPGITVKLKFIIEDPSAFLISKVAGTEHKIEFHDFYVTYDRILLKESEHGGKEKELMITPAIYPYTSTEIRTKGISPGLGSIEWYSAFTGNLPEQVVICMNSQDAADGAAEKNIFNFQRFGMKTCSLIVNSRRLPVVPLEFQDPATHYETITYRHYVDNCGVDISNAPTQITLKEYMGDNGYCIIPFDLTTDRCALFHGHEKKEGSIALDIKLDTPLTTAVNVYMIFIYKDYFYITGSADTRKVHLMYPTKKKNGDGWN